MRGGGGVRGDGGEDPFELVEAFGVDFEGLVEAAGRAETRDACSLTRFSAHSAEGRFGRW